jgi:hypothetical protein
MFAKFSFVSLLAVSILVSARPSPAEQNGRGFRVPLAKRASLINDDGTFDLDGAVIHTIDTLNKYRRNLINLKRNVGEHAFNEVSESSYALVFSHFFYVFCFLSRVQKSDLLQPSLLKSRNARLSRSLNSLMTLIGQGMQPLEPLPSHSRSFLIVCC